jgi:hypothetical protein
MIKLHVYVNREGNVMATGPAPDEIISKTEGGPVYAGFVPARGGDDLTLYEVGMSDDQLLRRDEDIGEYHGRIAQAIRARRDVKQLDFRKDLNLPQITQ